MELHSCLFVLDFTKYLNMKKEQYGNSETIENVKKLNNYFFVIEQRNYFLKLRKKEKENAEGANK